MMLRVGELARQATALADPQRLRIFAQLVLAGDAGLDPGELAPPEKGALPALARLEQAGLIRTPADGPVAACAEAFADALRPDARVADVERDAVARLFTDGRLTQTPVRPALPRAVLEHLTRRAFRPGVNCPEAEVSIAILQYRDDPSALRRYPVYGGHLTRSADGRSCRVAPEPVA